MELRHLRYFLTVAEELHFGRAADRLHIAQPPLSQQIQHLEAELGFQLFYRTKRSVQLTEAGRVFLETVRRILEQLEQGIELGRKTSRGEAGQLVVGFASSVAYSILPEILRALRHNVPEARLDLQEIASHEQVRWLHEGRIDVGFLRSPMPDQSYLSETVLQESLILALPETHPCVDRSQITLAALRHDRFIMFPRSLAPLLYDQIISLYQQAGFCPDISQEARQMHTIVSLVAGGLGVAIVPESLQHLQRTGVVYKPIADLTPKVSVAVIWRPDDRSPILQRFLEIVRQVAHEIF